MYNKYIFINNNRRKKQKELEEKKKEKSAQITFDMLEKQMQTKKAEKTSNDVTTYATSNKTDVKTSSSSTQFRNKFGVNN